MATGQVIALAASGQVSDDPVRRAEIGLSDPWYTSSIQETTGSRPMSD